MSYYNLIMDTPSFEDVKRPTLEDNKSSKWYFMIPGINYNAPWNTMTKNELYDHYNLVLLATEDRNEIICNFHDKPSLARFCEFLKKKHQNVYITDHFDVVIKGHRVLMRRKVNKRNLFAPLPEPMLNERKKKLNEMLSKLD